MASNYYSRQPPQLARECTQHAGSMPDVGMRVPLADHFGQSNIEDDRKEHAVLCFHGAPANHVEVKKEGAFKGKMLYLCGAEPDKCELFLEVTDIGNPTCKCGVITRENTVKKPGDNQGRRFLACGARKCKYFKWTS